MPDDPLPGSEEEKIIINATRIYGNAEELCDRVKAQPLGRIAPENRRKMINLLNIAEDAVDGATREFLRGVGYQGPLPKALQ